MNFHQGLEIGQIVTVFPYQPDPEILDSGFYLNMENIVPVQIIDECWYSLIIHNGKTGAMPGISVFNKIVVQYNRVRSRVRPTVPIPKVVT